MSRATIGQVPDDSNDGSKWWHTIAAGAVVGLGSFVASHWGGATREEVKTNKDDIAALRGEVNQLSLKCDGNSDAMKKYVDMKCVPPPLPKKPKRRSTEEHSGQ